MGSRRRLSCGAGLAACLLAEAAWPINFVLGGLEAQLDTSIDLSWSRALESADAHLVGQANGGSGAAASGDDGRLNFQRGDTFSKRLSIRQALELRRGDSGLYLSGLFWHDFALRAGDQDFKAVGNRGRERRVRMNGVALQEAFVFHHYSPAPGLLGSVRLGRQQLHWGEGQFIGEGLDIINPRLLEASAVPGTRLEDSSLPVNLLYWSQPLTDSWQLSAFYQLDWQQNLQPNCGTFLSQSDGLADGCRDYVVDPQLPAQPRGLETAEGALLQRAGDRHPGDSGQFGLAVHGFSGQTRWGLYWLNYHSRSGFFGVASGQTDHYRRVFPEDVRLYGLSLSQQLLPELRWAGELSFRPNAPVQISEADLLRQLGAVSGFRSSGFRRKPVTRLQGSLELNLNPASGPDAVRSIVELGYVHTGQLDATRYGRHPVFGTRGSHGFVTSDAWGYRFWGQLTYRAVLPHLDLLPELAFAHDVDGYGPSGVFSAGSRSLRLSLGSRFLDTYRARLDWVTFTGGEYDTLADRDYLSLSVGLDF